MNRRNFFNATIGLMVGALLPKSLLGDNLFDPNNPAWKTIRKDIMSSSFFVPTGKLTWPMKEYMNITVVGGGTRRPQGCHPRIWRNIKEGLSKSRAHGANNVSWVRWPANKPCKVTVGEKPE